MEDIWLKWFKEGLIKFGIRLTGDEITKFREYLNLIREWNKKFNLTGEKTEEAIAIKQFLDSLVPIHWNKNLFFKVGIDIGTGAGIPGIPLKIVLKGTKMVLVESMRKRFNFLEHCIKSLSLENVILVNKRGEELLKEENFREKFDAVFARWVLKIPGIFEISIPFAKVKGRIFLWKGVDEIDLIKSEESFINELGGKIEDIFIYRLPYFESERVLLVIKKVKETPSLFPRRWKVIKSLSSQRYKHQRE